MIKLSELQVKEVIIIDDGRRLGHISDLEIDTDNGRIIAIVIILKEKTGGFFGKPDELIIHWDQIVRIGSDVILVNEVKKPKLYSEAFSNDKNL
ncbi:YlmC/YmxH family sporulation protein [Virgibacillus profundi]|uniref:YlmC/YmxH family sporulation protein n=1 Tax=Virgibacillus profundi TaxID=2024555 RepID=A0A2A2IEE6_9BACI|nr:YlmC/YmxH family sporulation protein [Virgibacillus profundi]PAV29922.1 YlmC/YmxH family sporulation protein [Virgibacillus profundi]PXY54094.1 YlmC/YmxH family sporulation protein [Virgibacillus profundi]